MRRLIPCLTVLHAVNSKNEGEVRIVACVVAGFLSDVNPMISSQKCTVWWQVGRQCGWHGQSWPQTQDSRPCEGRPVQSPSYSAGMSAICCLPTRSFARLLMRGSLVCASHSAGMRAICCLCTQSQQTLGPLSSS